ncbi:PIN domain-containing protein [Microbacterium sp. K24]|uniref:PIN domain-containing protein n=1 Tax=Microbacterium sp. K24 TaxID=2305446 RepID=UPI00109C5F12|nr:PIN domain-containing protein [Microbacterium sp. K24]
MIYFDTSAAGKALIDEEGTDVVRGAFADGSELVSSQLLAIELHAALDRRPIDRDAVEEPLRVSR